MPENIYINTLSQDRNNATENDGNKKHVRDKEAGRYFLVLLFVFFLSLLANAVLGYLYYNTNQVMGCKPVTNYSNPVNDKICKEVNKPLVRCSDKDLPDEWVLNKDRFYVFHDKLMNWSHSRKHCHALNGDLVIIDSNEEQEFLAQQIVTLDALRLHWIGLTNSQTEGVWLWVDNTPLNNNLSWWIHSPDDKDVQDPLGEDCGVLNGFVRGEKWGDISCLKKERSICEIPCSSE